MRRLRIVQGYPTASERSPWTVCHDNVATSCEGFEGAFFLAIMSSS